MRKHHWKAVAVAAVLMMTVPALLALAAEKSGKPAPAGEKIEQAMPPGCGMHGGEGMGMGAGMPGCGMKAGKGACCMQGAAMKGCGMKGGKGGCCMQGAAMKDCGMKGGMAGCMQGAMMGGMGAGMRHCGTRGEMGPAVGGGMMCGPGMPGGRLGPGMGHRPMMLLHGLDLTPEQLKKLADLHEKQARLAIETEADLRLATLDLQELMRAEAPDRAKIDAQIETLAGLRAQLQKSRAATLLEARALLTPEQLKKWHERPMEEDEEDDERPN
jgi:Spy/CpxP family protein refolding chaperone